MKNFVQYIDSSFSLKVKELEVVGDNYLLSGIDRDFFPVSVFVKNQKRFGVDLVGDVNLYCLSVINDLDTIDLNVIPFNVFFSPLKTITFSIPSVLASSGGSSLGYNGSLQTALASNYALTDKYGVVRPVFVTAENFEIYYGQPFPNDLNVKRLDLQYDAVQSKYFCNYLHNIKGDSYSWNTSIQYDEYDFPIDSSTTMFNIDDVFVKVYFNDHSINFGMTVKVIPNYNFVVIDFDRANLKIVQLMRNANNTGTMQIVFALKTDLLKTVAVGLDWKQIPISFGS